VGKRAGKGKYYENSPYFRKSLRQKDFERQNIYYRTLALFLSKSTSYRRFQVIGLISALFDNSASSFAVGPEKRSPAIQRAIFSLKGQAVFAMLSPSSQLPALYLCYKSDDAWVYSRLGKRCPRLQRQTPFAIDIP
jgi:hypothetical protein